LSKDKLENQAALIVTGTVTEVKASRAEARSDGKHYTYELTVLVGTVNKGKSEEGATLIVRASYIDLKPGYVGGSGHHRLKAVEAGWKLHLYLTGPQEGVYRIVDPNGVVVVDRPAKEVGDSLWLWIVGGGIILSAVVITSVFLRRTAWKRPEPDTALSGGG